MSNTNRLETIKKAALKVQAERQKKKLDREILEVLQYCDKREYASKINDDVDPSDLNFEGPRDGSPNRFH